MVRKVPIKHDPSWPIVSLAEIAVKIGSGATPKGGADAYLRERQRFALVRSQNVFDRRFDHNGLAFISDEQAEGLRGVILQPNDVLLNITGDGVTFGRACLVPADILPACVNQHVSIIRVNPNVADAGYVLSFLTHPDVKSYIESFNAGGSRRAITKGHIESFRLPLPPLREQRAIAHILGTLDDKIELNRRVNETLEAMARALFKSWFVDFDPVRAKAEGCDPGLSKEIADLFPARVLESDLGEIPDGWDEGTLGDFIRQRFERVGSRKVVVLSAVASGKLARSDDHFTKRVYSKDTDKYLLVQQGDFAYNPSRINIGSIGMLDEEVLGAVSPIYVVVRPLSAYRWFLEFSLRRRYTRAWINTLASGSVRQALSYNDFASIPCVIPPEAVVQEFNRVWATLREEICLREAESNILANIRDTLLPKLLSGELRAKDARKMALTV